ncbi:hypothetical protein CBF34_00350 [Vagococcus penaei]|uniref:RNA polymerase sigma-70 ECF-like HTH domain-containing protein n=1 Tax=Vagococcus penaei TaxID=633807 RepID=A0A1Q2D5I5_9ENTE|nr:sigma-70 family RNA polymerase sigma factor [Vagococcus penaei]AQP53551.1 hypothetical protein BW732_04430 [Vagococcus penaei]RSU07494.1 hypothetical protein CBF34_00350 [Vagococcus penaei]
MNEKELTEYIFSIKSGNDDFFESVFKTYEPVVFKIKKKYHLIDFEPDDWLQEARFVCYQSIMNYDQSKGLTFGLFYKISLERYFISLLRRQEAKKRSGNKKLQSLDDLNGENLPKSGSGFNCDDRVNWEDYIYIRDCIDQVWCGLSFLEKEVLQYYIEGLEISSIACKLNQSEKVIQNAFSRAKKKFKVRLMK